jgi:ring-1,2-phenylacetyl-CoA epoxidase subunit PaaB
MQSVSQQHSSTLEVYEVFAQTQTAGPLVQQFSLVASTPDMALMLARENFFRRQACYQLCVVRRCDMTLVSDRSAGWVASHAKPYREPGFYRDLASRWRKYKHLPLTPETMV